LHRRPRPGKCRPQFKPAISLNTEHLFSGAFDSDRAFGRYLPFSSVVDDPHRDNFYFVLGGFILRQKVDAVGIDAQGIPLRDTDDNLQAIELVVASMLTKADPFTLN